MHMNAATELAFEDPADAVAVMERPSVKGQRRAIGRSRDRSGFDASRAHRAIRELLVAVGENPDREGLRETPMRVARAYAEMLRGTSERAGVHLSRVFEQATDGLVIVRDIEFASLCEHHLLPFFGKAHVAYRPGNGYVVGLSKIARTVDTFARRLQLQERMTDQIADAVVKHLCPAGVVVMVEAEHMCMRVRGAGKCNSRTVTVATRGLYKDQAAERTEVMQLLAMRNS